jgi:hypothetical protein
VRQLRLPVAFCSRRLGLHHLANAVVVSNEDSGTSEGDEDEAEACGMAPRAVGMRIPTRSGERGDHTVRNGDLTNAIGAGICHDNDGAIGRDSDAVRAREACGVAHAIGKGCGP